MRLFPMFLQEKIESDKYKFAMPQLSEQKGANIFFDNFIWPFASKYSV